ncbi:MAG: hypothetical protein R3344_04195 [Acidobacteriota bacterium]|nr:hypothetical protein [Acidobacteriota bacterium]
MRTSIRFVTMILVSVALGALPVAAAGPIDGEVGAVYWAPEMAVSQGASGMSSDATSPGLRAELWFVERYGLRVATYRSELDELSLESSDQTNLDFIWRVVSFSRNNYFALGAGWQQMDVAAIGLQDTSGARVDVDARVAATKWVYFYGQGAYLPSLDDTVAIDPVGGTFTDIEGYEWEIGVAFEPAPFLSIRAAYRDCSLDFTRQVTGTPFPGTVESNGYLVGLGVTF